ncbi:MAG: sigma-70 family RNA polymerase sigma factor [Anaerolineae bacterium]|nr:sigma-70 family RNA polymerase sigma factor [Anaerolineae bacterium]
MKEMVEMSFNPDFWEIPAGAGFWARVPADKALWYETEEDRERRYAMKDFYQSVLPSVTEIISTKLTPRQREVLNLYYLQGKTQEDIAAELKLSQSTVSRHLFGTVRNGRKVGGAIPKLQKVIDRNDIGPISHALTTLKSRFARTAPNN